MIKSKVVAVSLSQRTTIFIM